MDREHIPLETIVSSDSSEGTILHGKRLFLARMIWVAIMASAVLIYSLSIPLRIAQLSQIGVGGVTADQAVALKSIGISVVFRAAYFVAIELFVSLLFISIAVFIFWRKSNDWVVILISILFISYITTEITLPSPLEDSSKTWSNLINFLQAIGEVLSLVVFYIFPNGRFVPRWTRFFAFIYSGLILVWWYFPDLWFNPLHGRTFNRTPFLSLIFIILVWHGSSLFSLFYRYQRTVNSNLRQQMKWAVFGLTVAFLASTTRYTIDGAIRYFALFQDPLHRAIYEMILSPTQFIFLTAVPICFGIAILRYRLWQIDVIVNRSLVYGILTISVTAIYILVVGFLSLLFRSPNNPLLAFVGAGLVAILFEPLRSQLQRRVNRLLYGERDEPYLVLSQLSQRLKATLAAGDMFPTIVGTIARSFKSPYVAIALMEKNSHQAKRNDSGSHNNLSIIRQSYGVPTVTPVHLPLTYQGELLGHLLVEPRTQNEEFTFAEQQLLTDIANQAGVAVYGVQVMEDLQRARERLINAREEERRRLRRDLHDGVGPQLTSQIQILTAARRQLFAAPYTSEKLIIHAIECAQVAVKDIRRLLSALRPPVLDLGILVALQDEIDRHEASEVQFTIIAPEKLPQLPAAVEVACYRIFQEALHNVVRHANADNCIIKFSVDDIFEFEINDDGDGLPVDRHTGEGLVSMRERTEELGGEFSIESTPENGTCIRVRLPLP